MVTFNNKKAADFFTNQLFLQILVVFWAGAFDFRHLVNEFRYFLVGLGLVVFDALFNRTCLFLLRTLHSSFLLGGFRKQSASFHLHLLSLPPLHLLA